MFTFYKSTYNPIGLTGIVGGAITSTTLSGYLNELFAHVTSPPSGTVPTYQYRKIYITNDFETTSTYTRVWLEDQDHVGQIYLALDSSDSSTTTSPTGAPAGISGWDNPSNYVEGLELGTLAAGSHTGIWLKQELSNIIEEDPFATCSICVGGIIA